MNRSVQVLGDGADSEPAETQASPDSTIYVSMLDPIGELAFRPSPTKPIPTWMQVTRAEQPGYGEQQPQHQPASDQQQLGRPRNMGSHQRAVRERSSNASTLCPVDMSQPNRQARTPPRAASPTQSLLSDASSYHERREVPNRGTSFVSMEPLTLPSSRLMQHLNTGTDNLSSSTFSTYLTPPEYPSSLCSQGRESPDSLTRVEHDRMHPAPLQPSRSGRVSRARHPDNSSHGAPDIITHNPRRKLTKPPPPPSPQSHGYLNNHNVASSPTPLTSSEYVERYQQTKGPPLHAGMAMPSAAVLQEGRGEPSIPIRTRREPSLRDHVVAKIRGNSRAEPTTGLVSEEIALADSRPRWARAYGGEPVGVFSGETGRSTTTSTSTKRRSVQAELRRLFGR
jgi:hypothetical protein